VLRSDRDEAEGKDTDHRQIESPSEHRPGEAGIRERTLRDRVLSRIFCVPNERASTRADGEHDEKVAST